MASNKFMMIRSRRVKAKTVFIADLNNSIIESDFRLSDATIGLMKRDKMAGSNLMPQACEYVDLNFLHQRIIKHMIVQWRLLPIEATGHVQGKMLPGIRR